MIQFRQNAKRGNKNLRLIEVVIGSVFPPPPSKELRESRIELLRDELLEDDLEEKKIVNKLYSYSVKPEVPQLTSD